MYGLCFMYFPLTPLFIRCTNLEYTSNVIFRLIVPIAPYNQRYIYIFFSYHRMIYAFSIDYFLWVLYIIKTWYFYGKLC